MLNVFWKPLSLPYLICWYGWTFIRILQKIMKFSPNLRSKFKSLWFSLTTLLYKWFIAKNIYWPFLLYSREETKKLKKRIDLNSCFSWNCWWSSGSDKPFNTGMQVLNLVSLYLVPENSLMLWGQLVPRPQLESPHASVNSMCCN